MRASLPVPLPQERGGQAWYLRLSSFWKEEYPKGEVVVKSIKH